MLCLSLCTLTHLTSGASVRCENAATYSAGNEGQNFVAFSLKLLLCRDRTLSPLDVPYIRSAIFPADNTHAHCAYASSSRFRGVMHGPHDAVSFPCVLYRFTMIILGLEILARVVYLAGYQLALGISETSPAI